MAVCFVVMAVSDIEDLQRERFALFKAGLSPVDWGKLTKWQRLDLLRRHHESAHEQMKIIEEKKLDGLVSVLTRQILRV